MKSTALLIVITLTSKYTSNNYMYTIINNIVFNSVFALATPEELKESLTRWREKINDGTADRCLEESEELRKTIGLSTSVIAYKL